MVFKMTWLGGSWCMKINTRGNTQKFQGAWNPSNNKLSHSLFLRRPLFFQMFVRHRHVKTQANTTELCSFLSVKNSRLNFSHSPIIIIENMGLEIFSRSKFSYALDGAPLNPRETRI